MSELIERWRYTRERRVGLEMKTVGNQMAKEIERLTAEVNRLEQCVYEAFVDGRTTDMDDKWHFATDKPPRGVPEVEILFWDGVACCRTFGAYDHDDGGWWSGQEALDGVRFWAYPRPMPLGCVSAGQRTED